MKIRIKFSKHGTMKFIGHLDIMRYFQKAIRRSGIAVAYSEGFSPHQIMSFAAPLGVGLESNGEYFDLEVTEVTTSRDMMRRLNAVMAEGIEILSIKSLPDKAGNAMATVAAADYTIHFRKGYEPGFDWISQTSVFYAKPSIPVVKKTKKSVQELDIKPHLYQMSADDNGISMRVNAGSAGNIKPTLVMEAFYREMREELPEFALEITREDTYANIGTPDTPDFVPLDALGDEIYSLPFQQ